MGDYNHATGESTWSPDDDDGYDHFSLVEHVAIFTVGDVPFEQKWAKVRPYSNIIATQMESPFRMQGDPDNEFDAGSWIVVGPDGHIMAMEDDEFDRIYEVLE